MERLNALLTSKVKDKSVLINGGTTGIGKATAKFLSALGARVFIFGRDMDELDDTFREIRYDHPDALLFGTSADVANDEDIQRVFHHVDSVLGSIDILVNNAALPAEGIKSTTLGESRYIVETNILGYMACVHEAVKRMASLKSGHIVNVGSMSTETREESGTIDVATKAAIRGFSAALRKEVNPLGIKVTLIEPGAVSSGMQPGSKDEHQKKIVKQEMLEADDIAMSIVFCLSQPQRSDIVNLQIRPHLQLI